MERKVLIIAEHREGRLTPAALETVSCALEIGSMLGTAPLIYMAGKEIEALAQETAERTGLSVTALEGEGFHLYNGEAYRAALADILIEQGPAFICIPHSAMGYDLAPALAVRLNASCITAVEAIVAEEETLSFTRSQWGGKVTARMAPLTDTVVLTVLPGAWHPQPEGRRTPGPVQILSNPLKAERSRTTGIRESGHSGFNLQEAEVIVSAGKGLGSEENLHLLHELAGMFPRSAVGGSRAACDAGWIDYGRQIGQTGKTVTPKLYLACGISGSTQHVAGMKGSRTVIAINTDAHAPIFGIADYGIVDDVTRFIPVLLEAFKMQRKQA